MQQWDCPHCGHTNNSTVSVCSKCDIPHLLVTQKESYTVKSSGDFFLSLYIITLGFIGVIQPFLGIAAFVYYLNKSLATGAYFFVAGILGMIVSIGTAQWIQKCLETNKIVRLIVSKL